MITVLVFGGLALFFFALYQREVEKDLMPGGSEVIGHIVQVELDVARRLNSRLLWSQLESRSTVYRKDTIRTGPGSRVLVKLKNDSSIALGENTLVVLETENESLSLKLADGDVEFSGNVSVALDGNTKLRAVDGTLRIKRDANTGKDKVAAVSGKAEVMSDGQVAIVEHGEVLVKGQEGAFRMTKESMEEAGLKELGLKNIESLDKANTELQGKLNALNPNASMVKESGKNLMRMKWETPKEASKYLVKVGKQEYSVMDGKFDIAMDEIAEHLNEPISVRAIGSGAEGAEQAIKLSDETKDLVIAVGSVPKVRTPFRGSRILVQKKKITLRWTDTQLKHKDFMHYTVEMKFPGEDEWESFKTKTANLDFQFPRVGTYEWNVRANFKEHGAGFPSVASTFEVVGGADLAAPSIAPASETSR